MAETLFARILRVHPEQTDIPLPNYATEGSAGMDICAAVEQDIEILPGETTLIPSGFVIELPQGYEAQVRPRSGLAIKHSIGILNSPGTIDSDYRGEVKIILSNFGKTPYIIHRGDRIAQMIVAQYERVHWKETSSLADSVRGDGGFGHTGVLSKGKN
ncbi:MAG: dUTP diphosphatase [Ignavibacteriales bacterium]|nr:dUTP diphosphatase [Ignavibacteriales bacterium]